MSFFQDAEIAYKGDVYRFSAEEGRALESPTQYWHGTGKPSSWLGAAVCLAVRAKYAQVPLEIVLGLSAGSLGISRLELDMLIEWHENYMRWHDGDRSYTLF
ncbi:MAG: hypothetical protein JXA97_00825 [Anaerolineales bacterium]|nr:hypothetical protein [Anaerolineales bacterium]